MPSGGCNLPNPTQLVKWQNHISIYQNGDRKWSWRPQVFIHSVKDHGEVGWGIPGRGRSSLGSRGALVGLGATAVNQEVWKYFSILANSTDIQVYIALGWCKTQSPIWFDSKSHAFNYSHLSTPIQPHPYHNILPPSPNYSTHIFRSEPTCYRI